MENINLQEFVGRRKKEIFAKIKELRAELAQLRAVEETLLKKDDNSDSSKEKRGSGGPTFQEMIVDILKDQPNGSGAHEILTHIESKFDKVLMRSSLSPQLSRLKHRGVIKLEDGIWSLMESYLDKGSDESPPTPTKVLKRFHFSDAP